MFVYPLNCVIGPSSLPAWNPSRAAPVTRCKNKNAGRFPALRLFGEP